MAVFSPKAWVVANFLGWLFGIGLILLLSGLFDSVGLEGFQFYVGLGVGMGLGVMQWRMLHTWLGLGKVWLFYSLLGFAVPFLAFDFFSFFWDISLGRYHLPVCVLATGVISSGLYSLALKKYFEDSWKYGSGFFIGLMLALFAVWLVEFTPRLGMPTLAVFFANLGLILVGGPIVGWFTGRALTRMTVR